MVVGDGTKSSDAFVFGIERADEVKGARKAWHSRRIAKFECSWERVAAVEGRGCVDDEHGDEEGTSKTRTRTRTIQGRDDVSVQTQRTPQRENTAKNKIGAKPKIKLKPNVSTRRATKPLLFRSFSPSSTHQEGVASGLDPTDTKSSSGRIPSDLRRATCPPIHLFITYPPRSAPLDSELT